MKKLKEELLEELQNLDSQPEKSGLSLAERENEDHQWGSGINLKDGGD